MDVKNTHIVVVDDEATIRDTIREYLEIHGYRVTEADSARTLRTMLEGGADIDLVVLDVSMPGEDGLSLARFLRESTDVLIVMLTAAGEVVDRIVGLEMGADDYIAKPADLRELLARIKAVIRRRHEAAPAAALSQPTDVIQLGNHALHLEARKLTDASGEEIAITSMEFDLLRAFCENPNRVLSRDQLLELAHHKRWEPYDRSIDIRVGRLRKKLEADPQKPELIKTVHGVGYVFAPPVPA
ncbi:MAG: response regulator [Pseudomonadota bacterium]